MGREEEMAGERMNPRGIKRDTLRNSYKKCRDKKRKRENSHAAVTSSVNRTG